MRWAALLKGVNVGGNRRLPMADLRRFVESRGGSAVATLLASGNVVFDHPQEDADVLADHFRAAARDAIGIDMPWLLRSHDEIAAILEGNP